MANEVIDRDAVIGVFSDRDTAVRAVAAMVGRGMDSSDVGVFEEQRPGEAMRGGARRGLVTGAALGSASAALLEATVLAFPPAAAFVAGGTLVAALTGLAVGAGAGAAAGTLVGPTAGSPASPAGAERDRRVVLAVLSDDPGVRLRARATMRVHGALETRDPLEDRASGPTFATGFAAVAPGLRADLRTREGSDSRWPEVEPLYRYGWQVANRPDFSGRAWDEAASDVRRDWERRHPTGDWSDAEPYVRAGWAAVREASPAS